MTRSIVIGLTVFFLLTLLFTVSYAEQAWVLWGKTMVIMKSGEIKSSEWSAEAGYHDYKECIEERNRNKAQFPPQDWSKNLDAEAKAGFWIYECFPGTVDPRDKTQK